MIADYFPGPKRHTIEAIYRYINTSYSGWPNSFEKKNWQIVVTLNLYMRRFENNNTSLIYIYTNPNLIFGAATFSRRFVF